MLRRVISSALKRSYAKVTQPAPAFSGTAAVNGAFADVSLEKYNNDGKWVCLFFYPLDFTFVCPTELIAFSDMADKFTENNCQVVACSVDSHFSHLAWDSQPRKQGGLGGVNYPILADFNKKIAQDYGVLIGKLQYNVYHLWLIKKIILDAAGGIALRGLFLIDPKGVVRHSVVNDLPVGRSPEEALRILQAFQFVEEHGEVCPANWQPGKKTINPAKANEYFESEN